MMRKYDNSYYAEVVREPSNWTAVIVPHEQFATIRNMTAVSDHVDGITSRRTTTHLFIRLPTQH